MNIRPYHVSLLFFFITVISIICWAGFNLSWWEPLTQGDGRSEVLFILHVIGLVSPLFFNEIYLGGKND